MVANTNVQEEFSRLDEKVDVGEYNFKHFRFKHLVEDAAATVNKRGVQPGEMAPDFQLPSVDGPSVTLSDRRGKPVLLRFGSAT